MGVVAIVTFAISVNGALESYEHTKASTLKLGMKGPINAEMVHSRARGKQKFNFHKRIH